MTQISKSIIQFQSIIFHCWLYRICTFYEFLKNSFSCISSRNLENANKNLLHKNEWKKVTATRVVDLSVLTYELRKKFEAKNTMYSANNYKGAEKI